jgi:uncharacterized membrane protein (DUF2068 family)
LNSEPSGEPRGFLIIGAMRLASGLLMLAAGIGVFRLVNRDLGELAERYVARLHLDPDNTIVHAMLARVAGIQRPHLWALVAGTIAFALLHLVEGLGLLARKPWAPYLTAVATGSLLPLELYEITHKSTPLRISILVVNLVVLAYVVIKLRQETQHMGNGKNAEDKDDEDDEDDLPLVD